VEQKGDMLNPISCDGTALEQQVSSSHRLAANAVGNLSQDAAHHPFQGSLCFRNLAYAIHPWGFVYRRDESLNRIRRGQTMRTRALCITAVLSCIGQGIASAATITVDGTLDAAYGPAIAVQTVETQFGDANPPGSLGGSELDAAYAVINSGRLYIMLTGNHEPNFNKLELFIDSKPGGENVLSGTPSYDFFSGSSWISSNLAGLTFDSGFEVDYHLFSRWGGGSNPYEADFIDRAGGGSAMVPGSSGATVPAVGLVASGAILAGSTGPNALGSALSQDLEFAINNNNTGGVIGGSSSADTAAALAVSTGMEFSIDLADLGNPAPGTEIKICAAICNGNHNYLSNQFLGGLAAPQGNLGGDGGGAFTGSLSGVNLNQFAGLQFFTITVPGGQTATVVNNFVYHASWTGVGSDVDTGKVLAKEGAGVGTLNYSHLINSTHGINGVGFAIQDLAVPGSVSAADFVFQMSPTGAFTEGVHPPAGWVAAPNPSSITVSTSAPFEVRIKWNDNEIQDRWLRVTIKATPITGLAADETYYIGHLRGETGPTANPYTIAFADITPIRAAVGSTVDASSSVDIDKNGTIAFADITSMRSNVGSQLTNIAIP